MRCRALFSAVVAATLFIPCVSLWSQDKKEDKKEDKKKDEAKKDDKKKAPDKKPGVFTDPKEAGPDYLIQGEYVGEIGTQKKYGAQVVALGEGAFDVNFLEGGLPGDGWDTKTKIKVGAKTVGGDVLMEGGGWSGKIGGDKLHGTNKEGVAFAFKKIERTSPSIGAKPPAGAVVLFDGKSVEHWGNGKLVEDDLLFCGVNSKQKFGAGKYHFEFRTPFQPKARGQGRGNSGVYICGKEIQVLDSFGLAGNNNECGGYYGSAKPAVNMCYPPLRWQTYDVDIKADDKGVLHSTVLHNGVKIHDNFPLKSGPATINLQNHGNPVVFRNIWVLMDGSTDKK